MTELKTLNDLTSWHGEVKRKELRAEAIKWIKEDIIEEGYLGFSEVDKTTKKWMKRFNITEEDLK